MDPGIPRRVVYLDHCAARSGGEIALLRLLEAVTARPEGLEPVVVLGEHGPLEQDLRSAGIDVRVLRLPTRTNRLDRGAAARLPVRGLLDVAGHVLRLRSLLRELGPDLVHTNSLKSGIYGALAARLAGVPVVWHVRDRIAADYLPPQLVRLVRLLLLLLPDAVLVNSEATRATLGSAVRRAQPHRVLVDPYRPAHPGTPRTAPASTPRVALVGRLAPWKGQHLFVDAVESLHAGGLPVHGRLLGSALFGEEEYAATLAERVRTSSAHLELGSFTGDVSEALRDVDIVVNASVIPEPFGQVVVEALANGVPVVVPDAGGPAEIVRDGVTGMTFASGDAEELAAVLATLLEEPALYRRLSANGLARAQDFDPDTVAADYVRFLGTVRRTGVLRRLLSATRSRDRSGQASRSHAG